MLLAWWALTVGPGHASADVGGTCGLGSPDDVPLIDDRIPKPLVAPRLKPLRCVLVYGVCSVGPLEPCMCVDAPGVLLSLVSLDMLPAKLLRCNVGGDRPTRKRLFCCIDEVVLPLPSLGEPFIFVLNDTFFTVLAIRVDMLDSAPPTIPRTWSERAVESPP